MVNLSPAIIAERKLRKNEQARKKRKSDRANGIPPKKDKRTGSRDQTKRKKQDRTGRNQQNRTRKKQSRIGRKQQSYQKRVQSYNDRRLQIAVTKGNIEIVDIELIIDEEEHAKFNIDNNDYDIDNEDYPVVSDSNSDSNSDSSNMDSNNDSPTTDEEQPKVGHDTITSKVE
mmetsp:Transcript_20059/g.22970  ORF Transcript_20059/g.22970 Transcript_20059/m.22970 type:complete len:172 (-) Transcript_20059:134-649(-)